MGEGMTTIANSVKLSNQWHRVLKSLVLLWLVLFQSNAFACMSTSDSSVIPLFIIILFVCLAFILSIILVTYLVNRLFFERTNIYSPVVIAALIVAFIIGGFSSFLIPEYQNMYYEMGAALPIQTKFILEYRFLLWIPFIIATVAFIFKKDKQIQISWIIVFLCIEVIISMVVIWALYSAIFMLGGC